MFVLQHKGRVLNGPMDWNRGMFSGTLEDLKIDFPLPREFPGVSPFVIDQDTSVFIAELHPHEYNPLTEYLHGPFWQFTADRAIGTYQTVENPIDLIKGTMKNIVTNNRYAKEIAGAKVTIQGKEVTVDTARGARDVFIQKLLLMVDGTTVNWKFPEGWLLLTKADLQSAVAAGVAHVQGSFDWEVDKHAEIDACTTVEALKAVVLE
jgi:hypothetical protein